jgi:hypothetical protein
LVGSEGKKRALALFAVDTSPDELAEPTSHDRPDRALDRRQALAILDAAATGGDKSPPCAGGDRLQARREFDELVQDGCAAVPRDSAFLYTLAELANVAVALSELDAARTLQRRFR